MQSVSLVSRIRWTRWGLALACLLFPTWATAQVKSTILPGQFLRQHDPITVVFEKSVGPAKAGPEDQGERYLTIRPATSGAYRWIDSKTLEFRAADPWPALSRFQVSVPKTITTIRGQLQTQGAQVTLRTLLVRPEQMSPRPGTANVTNVTRIALVFSQALPQQRLREALRVELRQLPGTFGDQRTTLPKHMWRLKRIASRDKSEKAEYWLIFQKALPKARRVTVHLRLALPSSDQGSVPLWEGHFFTQKPFQLNAVRCNQQEVTVSWGTSRYQQQRALDCGGEASVPTLVFSHPIGKNKPSSLHQLVRFSPTVPGLTAKTDGRFVSFAGQYKRDVLYQMTIQADGVHLVDQSNQALQHQGSQIVFFYLGKKEPFLKWKRGQGILERFGPQMMPMHVRGIDKVDLRIHKIPTGDPRFWPYPSKSIALDETKAPPAPGNERKPHARFSNDKERIRQFLRQLGTPTVSKVVSLPKDPQGEGHRFGFDLSTHLRPLLPSTKNTTKNPTTSFLVGVRLLDGSPERHYVLIQVTDLALTTVEEDGKVKFFVTSLRTAKPIPNAQILLEEDGKKPLWTGKTDAQGSVALHIKQGLKHAPTRIRVLTSNDHLVLHTKEAPPIFVDKHWWPSYQTWLAWLSKTTKQVQRETHRGHLFCERPVYRPKEAIHFKGWIRALHQGKLVFPTTQGLEWQLRIRGPKKRKWEFNKLTLTQAGGVYRKFLPQDPPTGAYTAELYVIQKDKETRLARRSFRIEEYRIPLFEVRINAPKRVPSDKPFRISATGRYYAGGLVVSRPIRWRVFSRPVRYFPFGRKGYRFASSYQFDRQRRRSTKTILDQDSKLDAQGQSNIELDPTRSLDIRPHRYIVEAVITGGDGREISNRTSLLLLPPFNVGVSLNNRFRLQPGKIQANLIAVDFQGKLKAGIPLHVELLRREWHSHLVETDFVKGGVKYRTDIIDKSVGTCTVTSKTTPVQCPIEAKRSGVYILRVKARDKMGRLQTVSVDMYVKGTKPILWERPKAATFKLSLSKPKYNVGETAQVLLRSPYQTGRALAILEDPSGTTYQWLDIRAGQGLIHVPIQTHHTPSIPLHVLLMRGRVAQPGRQGLDPGRPSTVVSTIRIPVTPNKNRVLLAMKMPTKAKPRDWVDVELNLRTPSGQPVSGEVTFWAVDRAVLSLGTEGPLNPLGAFVKKRPLRVRIHDTRNLVLGRIPRRPDNPGGGAGGRGGKGRLVRKNFKSVPYYNPAIQVDATGKAKFRFQLPDDLTTFEIRAVAASGTHRFGFTKRNLLVRLPVMIQRTLPRFVRPGDRFVSGGLARVVEGPGGPGTVHVKTQRATIIGPKKHDLKLDALRAIPAFFSFAVPQRIQETIQIQMGVTRHSDKEGDTFQVKLPVRQDRKRVYFLQERMLSSLGVKFRLAQQWPEAIRAGSGRVEVLLAGQGEVLRSISALEYLMGYPHGCTEQRLSRAYPLLALENTLQTFALQRMSSQRIKAAITETISYIRRMVGRDGLVGYWPGSQGHPWLTAYATAFLLDAKKAGYNVPETQLKRTTQAVRKLLRSDSNWNNTSEQNNEQAEILLTLAKASKHEPGYIRALHLKRNSLDLFGRTRLLLAMLLDKTRHPNRITELSKELWDQIKTQKQGKKWVLQGITFTRQSGWYNYALASKTRTLAGLLEALAQVNPQHPRLSALKDALLDKRLSRSLGYGLEHDGEGLTWGNTQNNARALFALHAYLKQNLQPLPALTLQINPNSQGSKQSFQFAGQQGAWRIQTATDAMPMFQFHGTQPNKPIWMRVRFSYIPQQRGSDATAQNQGFRLRRFTEVISSTKGTPSRFYELKEKMIRTIQHGDILQEKVEVLTPKHLYNIVVEVPIASGLEAMNPNLQGTSSDAKPSQKSTVTPTHQEYRDDRVLFYFDSLPQGTHALFFRVRATTAGNFVYPPSHVRLMYQPSTYGRSPGYTLQVKPPPTP